MDQQKNLNIAFFGAVSVGKSTLINTLLGYDLSSCKRKRTTMVPFVYRLDNKNQNFSFINDIKKNINKINNDIIEKSEKGIIETNEISTEQIISLPQKNIFNLSDGFVLNIYDIPGLNDARTKNSYYQYLSDNFKKFDMVFFIIDINSSLNTSDEIEILEEIIKNLLKNKHLGIDTKFLIIVNKCDNMFYNDGKLTLDQDSTELYSQILVTLEQKFKANNIVLDKENNIVPISSEDSFVYKIFNIDPDIKLEQKYIDKFGFNEFGKTRWSTMAEEEKTKKIKNILQSTDLSKALDITGYNILINKINLIMDTDMQVFSYLLKIISYLTTININIEEPQKMDIYRNRELEDFLFVKKNLLLYKNSKYINKCTELYNKIIRYYFQEEYIKIKQHIFIYNIDSSNKKKINCIKSPSSFCIDCSQANQEQKDRLDNCLNFEKQLKFCAIEEELVKEIEDDILCIKNSLKKEYIKWFCSSNDCENYFQLFDKYLTYCEKKEVINYEIFIDNLTNKTWGFNEKILVDILQKYIERKYIKREQLVEKIILYMCKKVDNSSYNLPVGYDINVEFGIKNAYIFHVIDFFIDLKNNIKFDKYKHLIKYCLFIFKEKNPLTNTTKTKISDKEIFLKFEQDKNILSIEKFLATYM